MLDPLRLTGIESGGVSVGGDGYDVAAQVQHQQTSGFSATNANVPFGSYNADDLERATALARSFREQPTPEFARSAQLGVQSAISPNERLQYGLHPWRSYVIVPLFALANAGVHLDGPLISDAARSPITPKPCASST